MRIVLFTDTFQPQINGVARTLARWLTYASTHGHEVALVSPAIPRRPRNLATVHIELPSMPVPFYHELRLAVPLDPWSARRLRAFRPDLVHVATEFPVGRSGLAWAQNEQVPLVTSFHTDFAAYLAGYGLSGFEAHAWRYLRAFHDSARTTFCPSSATRAQLLSNGFHERLRIWPRGVDAQYFHPQRRSGEMRARLAPGAKTILLYVGRLAPEKRLPVLLDAFEMVNAGCAGTALVIVGDGPAAADLHKRNLPNVHLTGFLTGDDLACAYASADAFVFPSDTETFGNVIVEAMASGLPVAAVAQGGVLDTVVPFENGMLTRPGDAAEMAAAISRLVEDDKLRHRLAHGARSAAMSRSWDAVFDALFASYHELAATQVVRVA